MKLNDLAGFEVVRRLESEVRDVIWPEQRRRGKTVFYLRIQNYLLIAFQGLKYGAVEDCCWNLAIARRFSGECPFSSERIHAQRLAKLCGEALASLRKRRAGEHKLAVLFRSALGICQLRLLEV